MAIPMQNGEVVDPELDQETVQETQSAGPEVEYVFGEPPPGPELPPELAGKSTQDVLMVLQDQNRQLQERIAAQATAQDPTKAIIEGFGALREHLAPPRATPQMASAVPQGMPQRDPEEVRRKRNELIQADPAAAFQTILQEEISPIFGALIDSNQRLSRQLMLSNPTNRELYDRYGDEIEKEVAVLPPAQRLQNVEKLYDNAAATVRGRHATELTQAEVDRRVAEELEKRGIKVTGASPVPKPAPKAYVDTSQRPPADGGGAPPQPRKVYAPAGLKAWAFQMGLSEEKAIERWQEGLTPFNTSR